MISSQDTLAHIPFCGSGLQCARAESDHYLRNNAKYNMAAAAAPRDLRSEWEALEGEGVPSGRGVRRYAGRSVGRVKPVASARDWRRDPLASVWRRKPPALAPRASEGARGANETTVSAAEQLIHVPCASWLSPSVPPLARHASPREGSCGDALGFRHSVTIGYVD